MVPRCIERRNGTLVARVLGNKNGPISILRFLKTLISGVEAYGTDFSNMFAGLAGYPDEPLLVEMASRATAALKETPVIQTWVSRPRLDHTYCGPDLDHKEAGPGASLKGRPGPPPRLPLEAPLEAPSAGPSPQA